MICSPRLSNPNVAGSSPVAPANPASLPPSTSHFASIDTRRAYCPKCRRCREHSSSDSGVLTCLQCGASGKTIQQRALSTNDIPKQKSPLAECQEVCCSEDVRIGAFGGSPSTGTGRNTETKREARLTPTSEFGAKRRSDRGIPASLGNYRPPCTCRNFQGDHEEDCYWGGGQ